LESWLRGVGCVPLFNLMEDAATAEISRAQLWQWIHHKAHLSDGRVVTLELVLKTIDEELAKFQQSAGEAQFRAGRYGDAAGILRDLIRSPKFVDFLTLPAYDRLNATERASAG
jgi:malate synthase